jgi:hypothetical protein
MNLKRIVFVGITAVMIATTGCASNTPENNRGNRTGERISESINRGTGYSNGYYRNDGFTNRSYNNDLWNGSNGPTPGSRYSRSDINNSTDGSSIRNRYGSSINRGRVDNYNR